ncbi:MAG: hypothetical protein NTW35_03615, partial [Candidatus Nomurabacteria bacterium]|nr:hypothetical protein [Candidatus Nomurabacteria bacterium]
MKIHVFYWMFFIFFLSNFFLIQKIYATGSKTVDAGGSATISWQVTNASNCNAQSNYPGNPFSGSKPSSGSIIISSATAGNYTFTCTELSSGISDSVTLTVNPLINGSCASKCINFGNGLNCSASTYDALSPLCSNGTVTSQNTYTTYSAWGCTGSGGGTSASGCSACAPGYKGNGCTPITVGPRSCDGSTCGTGPYPVSCNFDSCNGGPTTCTKDACTIDCPNPDGTTTTYPAGTTCPTWTKYCTPYNDINGNNYQKWAYTNPLSGSSSWLHVPAEDSQCLWSATTCSASPACGTTDTYTQSWTCASNPSLCATNGHPDTTCSRTVCSCSATGWSTWNASAHEGTTGTTCGTYLSGYTLAANSSDTITSTRSTYSGSFQISCDAAGNFSNLRNFSCVPNTECVGAWSDNTTCSVSGACNQTGVFKQTYTISQAQSGTGTACPYLNGAIRTPTSGGTSCSTAVCSCSTQPLTWQTNCSGSTGVTSHGTSATINYSGVSYYGSAT